MYYSGAISTTPSATQLSVSTNLTTIRSSARSSNHNSIPRKSNWVTVLRPRTSLAHIFFKLPNAFPSTSTRHLKPFSRPSIVMEMQDCTVKMEVDVPASVAYKCYADREAMPQWMPFISSVKVLEDKPDLSRWTLKYKAFGRNIEFSWLARNLQPIPNQKIHWRSLEGLPNSGAVRFYPKGPSSCLIELTVSYEVPQLLVPVASALQPFLQSLLLRGLERFPNFAKSYLPDSTT